MEDDEIYSEDEIVSIKNFNLTRLLWFSYFLILLWVMYVKIKFVTCFFQLQELLAAGKIKPGLNIPVYKKTDYVNNVRFILSFNPANDLMEFLNVYY